MRLSEGFAPPRVGDWIISQVRGRMRQALMYHGDIKQEVVDPHRSCSDFEFDLVGSDLILILIRNRIAAVFETDRYPCARKSPKEFSRRSKGVFNPQRSRCLDAKNPCSVRLSIEARPFGPAPRGESV